MKHPMYIGDKGGIEIQIETITTCNARCHFCIYKDHQERWGKSMDMDLWRKIIDDVGAIPTIFALKPLGLGEPLLDQRLEERIEYARGKVDFIYIFTNGILLTPERSKSLRDAGMNTIIVSLNATNSEQHEKVMGVKGKYNLVCSNIEAAIALGLDVEVHTVWNGDQFDKIDAFNFHSRWGNVSTGGHGFVVIEGNWAGDNRVIRPWKPNTHCFRATTQINVLWDGRVSTCCQDLLGRMIFGNLNTQTIREVYNSEAYTKFREDHYYDRADKYTICAGCTRI
jgi:radical SAM protein with 4Fe4S-binding SPASM domain